MEGSEASLWIRNRLEGSNLDNEKKMEREWRVGHGGPWRTGDELGEESDGRGCHVDALGMRKKETMAEEASIPWMRWCPP